MAFRTLRQALMAGAVLALGAAAPAQAKDYTVGLSVATLANPFFQAMTKGVVDGDRQASRPQADQHQRQRRRQHPDEPDRST